MVVRFSNQATRRPRVPPIRRRCALHPAPACVCSAGLDMAGRWSRPAAVLVRPCAPVRGGSAPWRRPGRTDRLGGARAGERRRHVRRNRAERGQDRLDRDAVRVHGHARPSRLDRRAARSARHRRLRCRDGRAERRRRRRGAVRLLRRAGDGRGSGLRRSADVPARTAGRRDVRATPGAPARAACHRRARGRAAGHTRGRRVGPRAFSVRRSRAEGKHARDACDRRARVGGGAGRGAGDGGRGRGLTGRRDAGRARRAPAALGRGRGRGARAAGSRRRAPAGARARDSQRHASALGPPSPATIDARLGCRCVPPPIARGSARRPREAVVGWRPRAPATRRLRLPCAPAKAARRPTYHG